MNTPIKKETLIQINIVVKDITKAAAAWSNMLGIEQPEVRKVHLEGKEGYPYEYRGKAVPCDLLVCNIELGNLVLELHQPNGGESTFQEYLDYHGNGVHHLGFEVGNDRDMIIDELEKEGFVQRTLGIYPGSSWTIVDSEDVLGVNLNIKPIR